MDYMTRTLIAKKDASLRARAPTAKQRGKQEREEKGEGKVKMAVITSLSGGPF